MGEVSTNHLNEATGKKLVQTINRIERLEEEKKEIATDIREVYAEAKAFGFDTKTIRAIIKRRKADRAELEEQEMILDTYEAAVARWMEELT